MTVGAPCVEREEGSEHTETDEHHGEEHLLQVYGNEARCGGYLGDVHRISAAERPVEEVDAQDADDEQCRTAHEHQRQFHGCILFLAAAPHADEQVHGDEGHLVEHEHGEEIDADKEAEHTRAKECKPEEILLGEGFELPRGEGAGEDDDAREEQHDHRDTVDTHRVGDMERCEPHVRSRVEHGIRLGRHGLPKLYEIDGEIDGERQQER